MTSERRGGTPLWAKVLAAVLLVPALTLFALYVLYALSQVRESGREEDAFEATRADAARFADVLAAEGGTPSERDVREALDRSAGGGQRLGVLVEVRPTEHGTRVLVRFSRVYERTVVVFGPAEAMTTRCFTVELTETDRPRVTAHGPGGSCTAVAARPSP
ncbi:hypothetical protein [Streptomyces sp. NK15101]|uniref:hypothetical protein n=1 Tax=Streptomyces sp. NK15101 TaxID=2873261 RepID=UPI001CEC753A|nr:hypothetical protein [Streptomyces sp. NK15101]